MNETENAPWIELQGQTPTRSSRLFCNRCGMGRPVPMDARKVIQLADEFERDHSSCSPYAPYRVRAAMLIHSQICIDGLMAQPLTR